jgi:hypothetical protein
MSCSGGAGGGSFEACALCRPPLRGLHVPSNIADGASTQRLSRSAASHETTATLQTHVDGYGQYLCEGESGEHREHRTCHRKATVLLITGGIAAKDIASTMHTH